jgi:hypothetical protein
LPMKRPSRKMPQRRMSEIPVTIRNENMPILLFLD